MFKHTSNFFQRTISAILFAPVIVFALVWSPWTYFLFFFYVVMLAMLEFYKLLHRANVLTMRIYGVCIGLLGYTMGFVTFCQPNLHPMMWHIFTPLVIFGYISLLYRNKAKNPLLSIGTTFFCVLYIAIPFTLLHYLAFFQGVYSYELTLGLILMIWAQDTGAYLVGSVFGRHLLFSRISPKKTWEGLFGGVVSTILVAHIVARFFTIIPLWQWRGIGCILWFTGTYGDFVASLFKRSVHIKDTGQVIPGHGGLLDRIDSLLFTIPSVMTFLYLIKYLK